MKKAWPLKSVCKRVVGTSILALAKKYPASRSALKNLGLRTTDSLFDKGEVRLPTAPGRFLKLTNPNSNYLTFQLFWRGLDFYEPITAMLLQKLLQPGSTFVDIGANIGIFSLLVCHKQPEVKVIAFEPNPKNFHILKENVAANGFEQITCESIAVSNSDGVAKFFFNDSDMSASLVSDFQSFNTRADWAEVQTRTLDSYFSQRALTSPVVMKVDVEGHEEALLDGAHQAIASYKPDLILEVLAGYSPRSTAFLKELGYRFFPITNEGFIEAPELTAIPPKPFLFFNYIASTRPSSEIARLFHSITPEVEKINFYQTSKYFGEIEAVPAH
jgi:FkbM family methyltransferase